MISVIFLMLQLFFLCLVFGKSVSVPVLPEELILEFYSKYKEAVIDENLNTSSRRLFNRNKQYEIHVKKLKDVNGYKWHNLMIKESLRTDDDSGGHNPLVYINNPVESKIPQSYLTLEQFKEVLTNRVKHQRGELIENNVNKQKTTKKKNILRIPSTSKLVQINTIVTKNNDFEVQIAATERNTKVTLLNKANTVTKNTANLVTTVNAAEIDSTIKKTPNLRNLLNKTYAGLEKHTTKSVSDESKTISFLNLTKAKEIQINTTELNIEPNNNKTSLNREFFQSFGMYSSDTSTMIFDNYTTNETTPAQNYLNNYAYNINRTTFESNMHTDKIVTISSGLNFKDYAAIKTEVFTETTTKTIPTEELEVTDEKDKSKRDTTYEVTFDNIVKNASAIYSNNLLKTSEYTDTVDDNVTETTVEVPRITHETVEVTSNKDKPKRRPTQRSTYEYRKSTPKTITKKRSTLNRPLVFMGKA